jgi:hypothetical protein
MIPLMMNLRVKGRAQKVIGFWFPFFIVWFVIFPLILLAAPFVLICALIFWRRGKGKLILYTYWTILMIIGSMSGIKIEIQAEDADIFINLC